MIGAVIVLSTIAVALFLSIHSMCQLVKMNGRAKAWHKRIVTPQ